MKIKANGIVMNYDIAGAGDDLVLIHGSPDNLTLWRWQVPVFAKRNRVITYDIRGFGESEMGDELYSIELFAEDLRELLKALGVARAHILGYSMGGWVAAQFALFEPGMVRSLILANSSAGLPQRMPDAQARREAVWRLLEEGDMRAVIEDMTVRCFSPGFREKNPAVFDFYLKVKMRMRPESMKRQMSSSAGFLKPLDLARISCPALVITGEHDGVVSPALAREAQQALPHSRLAVLPAGHASMLEAPEVFNRQVLDFLAEAK